MTPNSTRLTLAALALMATALTASTAYAEGNLIGVRAGYILTGSGEIELESGGNALSTDFDEETSIGLNAFVLLPVSKQLRVGGSLWYFPEYQVSIDGNSSVSGDDAPNQVNANAMLEYALDFGSVAGFVYGEAGLAMLLLPDTVDDNDPYVGFNLGGGVGANFPISDALLFRVDGGISAYQVSREISDGGDTLTGTISGTRFMLNAGVAFGL